MTNVLQGGAVGRMFPFNWFHTPFAITVLFLICGILKITSSVCAGIIDRMFQNNLTRFLKSYLHDKIISLDAKYHQKHDQGENLFNVNNAANVVGAISMLFSLPLSIVIALILAIISLYSEFATAQIPLWLIYCMIPVFLGLPFIGYKLGDLINESFGKLRKNNMAVSMELLNSLKSPIEIQVMNALIQRSSSVLNTLRNVVRSSNKANILAIFHNQFTSISVLFVQVSIAFIIMIFYAEDTKIAGSMITCIMLVPEVFGQLESVIAIYIQAKQSESEIDATYAIITADPEIKDASDAVEYIGKQSDRVRFDNVQFGYDENTAVLRGISADFPAGKTIALVSQSGGGKSTMLHLLSRLYDPQQGAIFLGDQDIKHYTLTSLRDAVVRVSQFPLFIQGTLRDNFRLRKADASDDEIKKACTEAGIWNDLEKQSNGADPMELELSLGAENLSGGQRRLLAIAGAMMKKPSILLLDEPTTGVDAQTVQNRIYPFLKKYKNICPIVLVDHNMNFVRNLADMVLVLEGGKIVDFAPTEEVWKKEDSLFRKLWEEYNRNEDKSLSEKTTDDGE